MPTEILDSLKEIIVLNSDNLLLWSIPVVHPLAMSFLNFNISETDRPVSVKFQLSVNQHWSFDFFGNRWLPLADIEFDRSANDDLSLWYISWRIGCISFVVRHRWPQSYVSIYKPRIGDTRQRTGEEIFTHAMEELLLE